MLGAVWMRGTFSHNSNDVLPKIAACRGVPVLRTGICALACASCAVAVFADRGGGGAYCGSSSLLREVAEASFESVFCPTLAGVIGEFRGVRVTRGGYIRPTDVAGPVEQAAREAGNQLPKLSREVRQEGAGKALPRLS